MELNEKELLRLKQEIETSEKKLLELKGEEKSLKKRLDSEFNCKTLADAKEKILQLKAKIQSISIEIQNQTEALEQELLAE